MKYLDLLQNDLMKIVSRKVKDLNIIERKQERKENRKWIGGKIEQRTEKIYLWKICKLEITSKICKNQNGNIVVIL